jgi:hypothetical protein
MEQSVCCGWWQEEREDLEGRKAEAINRILVGEPTSHIRVGIHSQGDVMDKYSSPLEVPSDGSFFAAAASKRALDTMRKIKRGQIWRYLS